VLAVRGGILAAARSLPRHGDPSAALAPALALLLAEPAGGLARSAAGAATPLPGSVPPPAGPWLAAEALDPALLLAEAFAGRSPGVLAIAVLPGSGAASLVDRVRELRGRVPVRPPLGAAASQPPRPWRDLRRLEPPAGASATVEAA
jgi:hypothetical protein